jgi:hypothetical protein
MTVRRHSYSWHREIILNAKLPLDEPEHRAIVDNVCRTHMWHGSTTTVLLVALF